MATDWQSRSLPPRHSPLTLGVLLRSSPWTGGRLHSVENGRVIRRVRSSRPSLGKKMERRKGWIVWRKMVCRLDCRMSREKSHLPRLLCIVARCSVLIVSGRWNIYRNKANNRQSGKTIDLENWPIEALSPVDCFHPSEKAHQRVAAGFWNRMTLSSVGDFDHSLTFALLTAQKERAVPIEWEEDIQVRCLESGDRITLGV